MVKIFHWELVHSWVKHKQKFEAFVTAGEEKIISYWFVFPAFAVTNEIGFLWPTIMPF